jgi:hypothetical protein
MDNWSPSKVLEGSYILVKDAVVLVPLTGAALPLVVVLPTRTILMAVERLGGVHLGAHPTLMLTDELPPGLPAPIHRIHGRTVPKLPLGMLIPERRIPMPIRTVDVLLVGMQPAGHRTLILVGLPAGHQTLIAVGKAGRRRVGRLARELLIQEHLEVDGALLPRMGGGHQLMGVQTVIAHREASVVDGEVLRARPMTLDG